MRLGAKSVLILTTLVRGALQGESLQGEPLPQTSTGRGDEFNMAHYRTHPSAKGGSAYGGKTLSGEERDSYDILLDMSRIIGSDAIKGGL